jgi:hypothetical protein
VVRAAGIEQGVVLAGDCGLTTARYERVTPEDVRGTIELLERADAALAPARHDRSAKMLKNVKWQGFPRRFGFSGFARKAGALSG